MNWGEIALLAVTVAIAPLIGYIFLESAREVTKLAAKLDQVEQNSQATASTLGIIAERLTTHLEWSDRVFTPGGRTRGSAPPMGRDQ